MWIGLGKNILLLGFSVYEVDCKLPLNSSIQTIEMSLCQNLYEKPAQWLRYYGYLCSYNSRPFIDKDSWENHVHVGV